MRYSAEIMETLSLEIKRAADSMLNYIKLEGPMSRGRLCQFLSREKLWPTGFESRDQISGVLRRDPRFKQLGTRGKAKWWIA